jgi:exosortase B
MGPSIREMSTASMKLPSGFVGSPLARWGAGLAALLATYAPSYWNASQDFWQRDEHAHEPMILLITLWLFWRAWPRVSEIPSPEKTPRTAYALMALAACTYLLGRALSFSILEFASQPLMAAGITLALGGRVALKALWFPLLFLIFMVPLPGVFVDMATGTLKQLVSVCAEWLLALFRYPVGRTGVLLTVGPYQLLVADACSGLHSMFTLSAMGMLTMYLRGSKSIARNAVMLTCILPIAFMANVIRVMALVLITYHLGDEAGQGFLHGAAGIVLIIIAMLSFIGLDSVLQAWTKDIPKN